MEREGERMENSFYLFINSNYGNVVPCFSLAFSNSAFPFQDY